MVDAEAYAKFRRFEASSDPSVRWCPHPGCRTLLGGSDGGDCSSQPLEAWRWVPAPPPWYRKTLALLGDALRVAVAFAAGAAVGPALFCDRALLPLFREDAVMITSEALVLGAAAAATALVSIRCRRIDQAALFPVARVAVCSRCKGEACFDCRQPWHDGKSCAAVADESVQEWAAGHDTGSCPACQAPIERIDGCNHMTCRCRHQFCWLCAEPFALGHFASGGCAQFGGLQKRHDAHRGRKGSYFHNRWLRCQIFGKLWLWAVLFHAWWNAPHLASLLESPRIVTSTNTSSAGGSSDNATWALFGTIMDWASTEISFPLWTITMISLALFFAVGLLSAFLSTCIEACPKYRDAQKAHQDMQELLRHNRVLHTASVEVIPDEPPPGSMTGRALKHLFERTMVQQCGRILLGLVPVVCSLLAIELGHATVDWPHYVFIGYWVEDSDLSWPENHYVPLLWRNSTWRCTIMRTLVSTFWFGAIGLPLGALLDDKNWEDTFARSFRKLGKFCFSQLSTFFWKLLRLNLVAWGWVIFYVYLANLFAALLPFVYPGAILPMLGMAPVVGEFLAVEADAIVGLVAWLQGVAVTVISWSIQMFVTVSLVLALKNFYTTLTERAGTRRLDIRRPANSFAPPRTEALWGLSASFVHDLDQFLPQWAFTNLCVSVGLIILLRCSPCTSSTGGTSLEETEARLWDWWMWKLPPVTVKEQYGRLIALLVVAVTHAWTDSDVCWLLWTSYTDSTTLHDASASAWRKWRRLPRARAKVSFHELLRVAYSACAVWSLRAALVAPFLGPGLRGLVVFRTCFGPEMFHFVLDLPSRIRNVNTLMSFRATMAVLKYARVSAGYYSRFQEAIGVVPGAPFVTKHALHFAGVHVLFNGVAFVRGCAGAVVTEVAAVALDAYALASLNGDAPPHHPWHPGGWSVERSNCTHAASVVEGPVEGQPIMGNNAGGCPALPASAALSLAGRESEWPHESWRPLVALAGRAALVVCLALGFVALEAWGRDRRDLAGAKAALVAAERASAEKVAAARAKEGTAGDSQRERREAARRAALGYPVSEAAEAAARERARSLEAAAPFWSFWSAPWPSSSRAERSTALFSREGLTEAGKWASVALLALVAAPPQLVGYWAAPYFAAVGLRAQSFLSELPTRSSRAPARAPVPFMEVPGMPPPEVIDINPALLAAVVRHMAGN